MAVTTTNNYVPGILIVLSTLVERDLAVKTAVKVRKLQKALAEHWKIVEEVRLKLVEEYAEKDAEGNNVKGEADANGGETVKIREADLDAFKAAYNDLMSQEVELIATFGEADFVGKELSVVQIVNLAEAWQDAA